MKVEIDPSVANEDINKKMRHPKPKRHLSFEQLDSRIAMNADMHPSVSFAYGQPQTGDFVLQFELRSVSFARNPTLQTVQYVVSLRPYNPPQPHRFEGFLARGNEGMKSPPEAESSVVPSVAPPTQTSYQVVAASENPSSASVRSSPSVGSAISNLVVTRQDPPAPNRSVVPTSSRELVPATTNSNRIANIAPILDASSTKASTAVGLPNPQVSVLQSQSISVRSSIANVSERPMQPSVMMTENKPESTKSTANGMLTFALRPNGDRSSGLVRPSDWNTRNEYRSENANLNADTTFKHNLPIPKGMIEIGGNSEDHSHTLAQSKVSMASNNPFEILQLFIGSTNMVSHSCWTSGDEMERGESTESTTTKEDSLLAIAVGVLFVIASRPSRIQPSAGLQNKMGPPSL